MSEPKQDSGFIIAALVEANDDLQTEVSRLRVSNKICRTVIRALREQATSLRSQIAIAEQNDELFKSFCAGEFDAPNKFDAEVTAHEQDALSDATGVVESTI